MNKQNKNEKKIDDQADYYSLNNWMSSEEREKMLKQQEEQRQAKKQIQRQNFFTFDFAGRKVSVQQLSSSQIQSQSSQNDSKQNQQQQQQQQLKQTQQQQQQQQNIQTSRPVSNPFLNNSEHPSYVSNKKASKKNSQKDERVKGVEEEHQSRIQHDYYALEANIIDDSNEISLAENSKTGTSTNQSNQSNLSSSSSKRVSHSERFSIRGVIENFAADVEWIGEDRSKLIGLMLEKQLDHYLFIDTFQSNNHLPNFLVNFQQECKKSKIMLNYAVSLERDFKFEDENVKELLAARFLKMGEQGVRHFSLLFPFSPKISEAANEIQQLAQKHSSLINSIRAKLVSSHSNQIEKKDEFPNANSIQFYIYPSYSHRYLIESNIEIPKLESEYFRNLNNLVNDEVIFLVNLISSSTFLSPSLCIQFRNVFSNKRRYALWNRFPSQEHTLQFQPFRLNQPGIEIDVNRSRSQLLGILVEIRAEEMITNNNDNDKSQNHPFGVLCIALSTVFDYISKPSSYDPQISLKSALVNYLGNERIADDIWDVLSPSVDDSSLMQRKLSSSIYLNELQKHLLTIKNSQQFLPPQFYAALEPYLAFLEKFISKNKK